MGPVDELYTKIEAYEQDEAVPKQNSPSPINQETNEDHSEDLTTYLWSRGMQRLGVAVYALPYVNVSTLVRSLNVVSMNPVLTHMVRMVPTLSTHTLQAPFFLNGTSNSCVFKGGDGRYFVNCRIVNYKLDREHPNNFILPSGVDYFQSSNVLLEFAPTFDNVLNEKVFGNDDDRGPVRGLEDVRVMMDNDGERFHYIASMFHENRMVMSHGSYDATLDRIVRAPIESPYNRPVEKNWCMFSSQGHVRFVYRWNPLEIGKVNGSTFEIVFRRQYESHILRHIKGSSCGVYDDITRCTWFLVHFHTENEFRQYYHMFILLDPETYSIRKVSSPFTFEMDRIEFAMGLVVEASRVVISYTVFDETARVIVLDRQELERMVFGDRCVYAEEPH